MNLTRQTRREMMKSSARLGLAGLSIGAGFLSSSFLWCKPSPRSGQRFKIGACDWTLGKRTDPEALEIARRLGLDGIMVDMGDPRNGFPLLQPELQKKYLTRAKELKVEIASLALGILNELPYKSEPQAQQWVADSLEVSRALGTHVVLLAFFGKGDLKNDQKGTDAVSERLKEIRKLRGTNRKRAFAIDRSGNHFRSRHFRRFERLTSQVRLIHSSLPFQNHAVHRTNFMRKHDKRIPNRDLSNFNIGDTRWRLVMRRLWHPPG